MPNYQNWRQDELQNQLFKLESRVQDLQQELNRVKTDDYRILQEMDKKRAAVVNDKAEYNSANNEYHAQKSAYETKVTSLEKELRRTDAQVQEIKRIMEENN